MADTPGPSGHRRRVGAVTSNACTECRKKRSKCDGQTPCSRCRTQNATCVYETPVRQTKDEMRSEIDELRTHKAQTEQIIAALRGDASEEVLVLIRSEKPVSDIYRAIETGKTKVGLGYRTTWKDPKVEERIKGAIKRAGYMVAGGVQDSEGDESMSQLSIVTRFQNQNMEDMSVHTRASEASTHGRPFVTACSRSPSSGTIDEHRVYGQQQLLGAAFSTQGEKAEQQEDTPDTWTLVSNDPEWVYHLMTLYFCWEYPTFASLSKEYFLEDFSAKRRRYCSSLLVNAMLALGCRFSTLPEARTDPNNPITAGDHFFAEAKRLLAAEHQLDKLANIQALGLMAIREGSCGRDTESFYYAQMAIRIAVEIGLHKDHFPADTAEREVRAATFWGAFTLDQAWSLSLSKMPHLSYNVEFPRKPSIHPSSEMAPWLPYTDYGVPEHIAANQPCNVHSVYKCFCELSTLIHSALYTLCSPQQRFTSQDLIHHYQTYMNWYDEMPEVLKLGSNFSPSVLFVHIYFHYAVLLLFLPFINLRLSNSDFIPSVICATSAEAITTIITFYRDLYTLNHTPSMTPYLILMSTIAHLKSPHSDMEKLRGSIEALREMTQCHGFASRALEIVKYLAGKWGVRGVYSDGESDVNIKRDWEAVRPRANSTNLFVPRGTATGGVGVGEAEVLFSVFPLQGLPLIGSGEELERDGFYIPGEEERRERDGRYSEEASATGSGTQSFQQNTPGSNNGNGGGQSGPGSSYGGSGDYGMHGPSN